MWILCGFLWLLNLLSIYFHLRRLWLHQCTLNLASPRVFSMGLRVTGVWTGLIKSVLHVIATISVCYLHEQTTALTRQQVFLLALLQRSYHTCTCELFYFLPIILCCTSIKDSPIFDQHEGMESILSCVYIYVHTYFIKPKGNQQFLSWNCETIHFWCWFGDLCY